MNVIINLIIFICLGIVSLLLSILTVVSRNLSRSIIYLFLILLCTAGFYLFLNYHFLAAVQISVYAGGIVVLFIFANFLTGDNKSEISTRNRWEKHVISVLTILGGITVTMFALLKYQFVYIENHTMEGDKEISVQLIGKTLIGVEKYQYLLPFEMLSLLLLACIIGGILVARKR